jgi:hypothetical protein
MADDEGRVGIEGLTVPEHLRPIYANYVNVNHTPWDFRLVFGVVRTPVPGPEREQVLQAEALYAEAVAELILPANLMHGFLTALQENFSRYLEQYGPPGLDPAGPGSTTD